MVIAGFFAISCFNVIEIIVFIFNTFKRRNGLYFWSMLVASMGIPVHAVAVLLRYFQLAPDFPMCVVTVLGWYAMVTGQAVVLYSRLHLVVSDDRKIRWVLIMIITNACILHLPVTVLFLGSNLGDENLLKPFIVYEKIQLTGFCIQEFTISGLYIWEAMHALKPVLMMKGPNERKVIKHLILINILIVFLDISLLITEYTNNFDIQTTYKTAVYSIKLKMEFNILNQLLYVLQGSNCVYCARGSAGGNLYHPDTRGILQRYCHSANHNVDVGTERLDPSRVKHEEDSKWKVKIAHIEANSYAVGSLGIESDHTVQQRTAQQKV
jgi:hypothetical protein